MNMVEMILTLHAPNVTYVPAQSVGKRKQMIGSGVIYVSVGTTGDVSVSKGYLHLQMPLTFVRTAKTPPRIIFHFIFAVIFFLSHKKLSIRVPLIQKAFSQNLKIQIVTYFQTRLVWNRLMLDC